ncbi:helicase-exonuclease AddAB subunit AddB [Clostridium manihotivorum]|uniref:ATP-dependent helicase/deoxyribonuclease subunit B n=1 Tax=Clostridium manihotivorum TaxID=2320868 RepID=A0A410DMT3_9CLOT|nr:helicase-exonuclease AddAB subunit AddB [Clostridium manihotivorum]QAA30390.1 helicase-exonuclease AddAB subunit AddB [Clostridium manihotivorum]
MGIKFIYGRAGSGKSYYCIEEIKKRIEEGKENKLILLVPEQITFQTETRLLKHIGEKSVLKSEVLSFKRMAHRVFNFCGGITHKRMNEAGRNMLIFKVLEEVNERLSVFYRASKQQGFVDVVSRTITEFKKYNITSEILNATMQSMREDNEELKMKLSDLSIIFDKFNELLHENYIDSEDELNMLSDKLDDCNIFDGADIWVDEFTTFTPQQLGVLGKLMKKANNIYVALTLDETHGSDETDIFNVTKNTEKKLLRIAAENNIPYDGYLDLNNRENYRFKESRELNHLERHFFSYPFVHYKWANDDIRLYKANNNYDEIEVVAKDILRLVREQGYRYRDISVVCRQLEDYEKIASVIFNQYNIPYFLDKKRDIVSNPLIVLITSVFEILSRNWSYESVFKYLKTGLTGIDGEYIDILENYVLANGIKGKRWLEDWWEYKIDPFKQEGEELSEEEKQRISLINDIKDEIRTPLIKFYSDIKGKHTIRETCVALYDFMNSLDIIERMDSLSKSFEEKGIGDKAKEYDQVVEIIMEVLDQAVDVMGEEVIEASDFIKILNVGFEKYEIGLILVALDQVNIGEISRIRSRELKALYIIGANDGVFPASNKDEGILSDMDRELLRNQGVELASDTKTKAFEEQFLVYTTLTMCSNYLMITYPLADFEGKSLRPSIIIPRLKKIFPNIKEESDIFRLKNNEFEKVVAPIPTFNELIGAVRRDYDKKEIEDYWAEVYSWYKSKPEWKEKADSIFKGLKYSNQEQDIARDKIKKIYSGNSDNLLFSVSRIEKYAQCPFAYYVQYGLKAKDRKVYEFTPPDLGSFMHNVLDEFTNYIRDKKIHWDELDGDKCRAIISDIVDKQVGESAASILNSSKRYEYFTNRFKNILTKSVSVISEQMRRSNFDIFRNEFEFGSYKDSEPIKLKLSSGDEVFLTGRIDRVDTVELDGQTYIRIIDYKSGSKEFDLNQLYYGLQIQLLVYLDALIKNSKYFLDKQVIPGAILYFRIDDPIIKSKRDLSDEELKEQILKKLKMDGLLLKDARLVKAMDKTMETYSLVIPATFKKDGDFTKQSAVITEEQFDILRKYVNEKMIELCEEMLSGRIKIEPSKDGKFTYCSFCNYSHICQFDLSLSDNKHKVIQKHSDEEVWKEITSVVVKDLGGEK